MCPWKSCQTIIADLHFEPENAVFVTMGNDETAATEAWKMLVAESVPNVLLAGRGHQ